MKALALLLGFGCAQPGVAYARSPARSVEDQLVHRTADLLPNFGLDELPYIAQVSTSGSSYVVRLKTPDGVCFYSACYDHATLRLQSAKVASEFV